MPSSCADLQRMGQKVNGFFLVKGSKKMEMIYCNFFANQNGISRVLNSFVIVHLNLFFFLQTNRNGLDTPTSNLRPSISTSREIQHLTHVTLRFRSSWCGWTREMPWIWHRENSRHRGREIIFSLSRERRVFFLHLLLGFYLLFIWTKITSVGVMLKRETAPLINGVHLPSSRRWIKKKAIEFGCRFEVHSRLYMTTVATWPISRVSCWRRKLSRPFEVQLHRRRWCASKISRGKERKMRSIPIH